MTIQRTPRTSSEHSDFQQRAKQFIDVPCHVFVAPLWMAASCPIRITKEMRLLADQWEPYLIENRQSVDRLTHALADAETDLNDRVYALFQLTPDEIKLLQREVEH